LPDGYNVSSSVSSNDYIPLRKKDFQPERNHHPPVTNGHNARTSQINIHANDSAHAQAPRYDNSQYVGRRTDASLNSVGHSHNNSPPLSPGVYRSDSSHESILKYDNSRGNFLQKDDQPIISAYTLGSSVKGSYLTARDRDFSIDRQTRAERIDPEGTLAENNDLLKRTKLGMKVRQHKDLKGQGLFFSSLFLFPTYNLDKCERILSKHVITALTVPLSAQHLMKSMLFLACILHLASGHLLSPVPPFGIPYPLCPQFPR